MQGLTKAGGLARWPCGPELQPGHHGFVPMPLERLPFKAAVVISSDDESVTPERRRGNSPRPGERASSRSARKVT